MNPRQPADELFMSIWWIVMGIVVFAFVLVPYVIQHQ